MESYGLGKRDGSVTPRSLSGGMMPLALSGGVTPLALSVSLVILEF